MSKKEKDILTSEDRFLNRELSWLAFNERVLEESQNTYHPLLERLKFLSISSNNLDEFYMVRVSGLKTQITHQAANDTLSIEEQLSQIHARAENLIQSQQETWRKFIDELDKRQIQILNKADYLDLDKQWLQEYFHNYIVPNLSISFLDDRIDFPLIPNLSLATCVFIKKGKIRKQAIINISSKLNRFIQLPALRIIAARNQKIRFALLGDIITLYQELLFPDYEICSHGMMHIIRDSELVFSDEADDLISSFEAALQKRGRGDIIRIAFSRDTSPEIQEFLMDKLQIDQLTVIHGSEFLSLSAIMELCNKNSIDRAKFKYQPANIRFPERINDYGGDCFAAIDAKDIIVHHPYESFDVVVKFLQQAAQDPYVTQIKQTLYRVGSDNSIVLALIDAAKAGKQVTVIVELQARFDEAANLSWGKELQEAGAKVIYGISGLKVHAKMSLVTRRLFAEESNSDKSTDNLQSYVHFGTGNYHPQNARIYSDLSFFTCDRQLCDDAAKIFRFLEGGSPPDKLNKLCVAPFNLREKLIALIDTEIAFAKDKKPAHIWLKMNSLADKQLIDKLYEASQAGVIIELIIRGVCCIRPQVKFLSENIHVKSIIGRFLEHSRIYCFGNGHILPSPKAKIFIGPSDWIRNKLEHRVEIIVPIENKTVHEQVLTQIMLSNFQDKKQTWQMFADGSFKRLPFNKNAFCAHEFFLSNPSLSGRGLAISKHIAAIAPYIKKSHDTDFIAGNEVATLDIGSNSVRLVIYDGLKRTPLTLFNEKVSCQLAKNLETTGNLNIQGVKLAYKSIQRFVTITKSLNVKELICFATSAVRDAKDGEVFVRNIEENCQIKIQILSGEQEAYLAALGIASAFYNADGVVGDLGGGSLELAQITFNPNAIKQHGKGDIVNHCTSFPIGLLRLKAASHNNIQEVQKIISVFLKQFPLKKNLKNKAFYAVGGSFRTIAKIHISRTKYPLRILEQYSVSTNEILPTLQLISKSSPLKISKMQACNNLRAKTLANAALLMINIIKVGHPKKIIFSTHGIREGVLFDRLEAFKQGEDALISGCADMIDYISPSTQNLSGTHDKRHIKYGGVEYGEELYSWLLPVFQYLPKDRQFINPYRLHQAACILSRLAWHEHSSYRAEMAFRWVIDSKIPAMNHEERIFIASILYYRYQSKNDPSITKKPQNLLKSAQLENAKVIGLAMRLGYQLSGGVKEIFIKTQLSIKSEKLILSCPLANKSLINNEVEKRLDKLARLLKLTAEIK